MMQGKLKIRKSTEESGHRRSRTDYQNIKRLIENYTKPPTLMDSNKLAGFTRIALQHRMDSKITATYRREKNASITVLQTEHKDNSKTKTEKLRDSDLLARLPTTIKATKKEDSQQRFQETTNSRKQHQGASRYELQNKVGSGTFGVVTRARDKKTLDIVAIKKVFQDRRYKNRELQILMSVAHPNVLEMRDYFFTYENGKQYLNVVMNYYPVNLLEFILNFKTRPRIPKLKFKVLAFQMFKALLYLQEKGIAHRDIKPHNFLVDESGWKTVICDFGSAKALVAGQENIAYICSRCYRAPELIIGNTQYNTKIDIWSTACMLVEMVTGEPIFKSSGNMEQFIEIVKVLGTPSEADLLQMNFKCNLQQFKMPSISKKSWAKILKCGEFGEGLAQLLDCTLVYSPKKRLSPEQVLSHSFFQQLKVQAIYEHLRAEEKIPPLFNFSKEMKTEKFNFLIPAWHKGGY